MKKRSLNVRLYLMYILALAPLIVFGAYKNGLYLYKKAHANLWGAARPLVILSCAVLASLLGAIIREKRRGVKSSTILEKVKGDVVEAMLVAAILPISSNIFIVMIIVFIFSLFLKKLKFNRVALMYLAIIGVNGFLGINEFRNAYELGTILNYNGVDLLFGSGPGGIFATNAFLIFLAFAFLCFNKLYKKETVMPALLTFITLGVASKLIMKDIAGIARYIFGYNILFIIVFVAPNLYSSSYTAKGQITSGILIGLLTVVISTWTPYTSAALAVVIISLCKGILDRIFTNKIEKR